MDPFRKIWVLISLLFHGAQDQPWRSGVALFSFRNHSFEQAVVLADSAGAKFIEGYSYYKMGPDYHDSSLGHLDAEGIVRLRSLLRGRHMRMSSCWIAGGRDAHAWQRFF